MTTDESGRIAEQNDAFRKAMGRHGQYRGQVMATREVMGLSEEDRSRLFSKIQAFSDFAQ